MRKQVYMLFIDIKRTYDSVGSEVLRALQELEGPIKLPGLIRMTLQETPNGLRSNGKQFQDGVNNAALKVVKRLSKINRGGTTCFVSKPSGAFVVIR